jgi:hypothetical protein
MSTNKHRELLFPMAFETGGTPFFKFVAVLVFVLCLAGCEESSKPDENWQQVSMEENLAVLKTDPGNCFALGQVAAIKSQICCKFIFRQVWICHLMLRTLVPG